MSQVKKIRSIETKSEIGALLLEANYIKLYKPKYNAKLTDGKAYPLIRITMNDKYPKVLIARKANDNKSLYFGPFPNSSALRLVLKTIRRIFPYQSVVTHPNKLCLYNHLGLCPCPQVTKDKDYKKNIKHIVMFLKGNTTKVVNNLEKERGALSKLEEFEGAEVLQKKIDAINYVTSPLFEKFDHKIIPNLDEDIRFKELLELKVCLLKHNVQINNLNRIECFDISNISGKHATGSMVVFVEGEKDSSQYRRFKIKYVQNVPDDFAMMQEILQRRLRHPEWSMPDLIIVDGGKGQVSAALNALKEYSRKVNNLAMKQFSNEITNIPIIGLAKREEVIVFPLTRHSGESRFNRDDSRIPLVQGGKRFWTSQNDAIISFSEISLPKDSPALHLIMRIRDEAHRFAITYHKKLRSKSFLS